MPTGWYKANIDSWEKGFATLSKFRVRKGHCLPSRYHVEGNVKLGQWVSTQRYRKDFLPLERKRRLDAIGFVWDWIDYRWEQGFTALLKFKRREGHCHVPIFHNEGNHSLGWWVSTQRRNRKILSSERKARLNKIGFVWNENRGTPSHRARTS
jgi:Helicase associated domain